MHDCENEEDVLARCLGSVQGAVDQIVVVDTGSTDTPAEIAARATTTFTTFVGGRLCGGAQFFVSKQRRRISSGWTPTTCCWTPTARNSSN
ncbi:MAG: glycosyltransferase [Oscillospiraceae bacterium]